jgi:hypothetical protein
VIVCSTVSVRAGRSNPEIVFWQLVSMIPFLCVGSLTHSRGKTRAGLALHGDRVASASGFWRNFAVSRYRNVGALATHKAGNLSGGSRGGTPIHSNHEIVSQYQQSCKTC